MKGSLEGVLPMIGLLIISALLAMQTLPIAGSLNSLASESAEDLGNLAETRTGYDSFERYYVEGSMKYSVNNAAYEITERERSWESLSQSADDEQYIFGQLMDEWYFNAESEFDNRLDNFQCSIINRPEMEIFPTRGYNDLFTQEGVTLVGSEAESSELGITCNDDTKFVTEEFRKTEAIDNGFVGLAATSSKFFYQVDNVYSSTESEVQDTYEEEMQACDGFHGLEPAADIVESDYSEDTPEIDDIESNMDYDSRLSADVNAFDLPSSADVETVETDEVCPEGGCEERYSCGDYHDDLGTCSQVGCDPQPQLGACLEPNEGQPDCKIEEDDKYYYNQTATLEPEQTNIDFEVTDDQVEIVADGEGKYLDITVNNFEYSWN